MEANHICIKVYVRDGEALCTNQERRLVTVLACDKFSSYIIWLKILIETDHKPLVPLFRTVYLDSLPPQILRFRSIPSSIFQANCCLLLMHSHVHLAPVQKSRDTTGRGDRTYASPSSQPSISGYVMQSDWCSISRSIIMNYCRDCWPGRHKVEPSLKPYWKGQG